MREFDIAIVGQGLAGTALAWTCHWRGWKVLLIDREEQTTSSKIAAGLITPITGKRFVKSERFDEYWESAQQFYSRIAAETGKKFWHPRRHLRFFRSADDRDRFAKKTRTDEFDGVITEAEPEWNRDWYDAPHGGFEMTLGAQLDVPRLLQETKTYFSQRGCYHSAQFDPRESIQFDNHQVSIPELEVVAACVIFCDGFRGKENPYESHLPFNVAQGEILTLEIPELTEQRIVHGGVWLAPVPGESGLYRCGSTYEWDQIDGQPTAAGREDILRRLRKTLRLPVRVVDHQAGVRPAMLDSKPAIGLHPHFPSVGYLNGLGSKGSLQGPRLAEDLAALLSERIGSGP
ncbi:NAD(P)/FAD-dependent oxidoreductase [Calycomorphotria hydatis]|nr:FAD-binding oxidoreductase [Calycomorphotria hydatis]